MLEKFAKELLDSVDNLERAIQAAGEEQTPVLEGVKLTLKSLLTTLEKFGVVEANTQNGFNADLHQAVGIDPNAKANEIDDEQVNGGRLSTHLVGDDCNNGSGRRPKWHTECKHRRHHQHRKGDRQGVEGVGADERNGDAAVLGQQGQNRQQNRDGEQGHGRRREGQA